jgi:hypothetical protein
VIPTSSVVLRPEPAGVPGLPAIDGTDSAPQSGLSIFGGRTTLILIDRLIWHHDGPFGDASAIPTYIVSELTRRARGSVFACGASTN